MRPYCYRQLPHQCRGTEFLQKKLEFEETYRFNAPPKLEGWPCHSCAPVTHDVSPTQSLFAAELFPSDFSSVTWGSGLEPKQATLEAQHLLPTSGQVVKPEAEP